jgi:hypothetical protein
MAHLSSVRGSLEARVFIGRFNATVNDRKWRKRWFLQLLTDRLNMTPLEPQGSQLLVQCVERCHGSLDSPPASTGFRRDAPLGAFIF